MLGYFIKTFLVILNDNIVSNNLEIWVYHYGFLYSDNLRLLARCKLHNVHNPVAISKSNTVEIMYNLGELSKKKIILGYSFMELV